VYSTIMAPTAGSENEAAAISVAVKLARGFEADLRLVRVDADQPVGPAVRDHAREFNVDLIVMSSHVRGGMQSSRLGQVTDYIIRHTNLPVLVVKPPVSFIGGARAEGEFRRIVVPLDGSALAEQILPAVAALALQLKSAVSLLRILTPLTQSQKQTLQPGLPWWDTDIPTAEAHLTRAASYLTAAGIPVIKDVVLSDDIATAILDYSRRTKADLIAIATSGSGGMSQLVFGSVAAEVTRKSPTSLLVFHPKRSPVTDKTELPSGQWQRERGSGAFARIALDPDPATVCFDNALRNSEAEAGALPVGA
jgi:nucleotide-binding universal stress UspA family protein